MRVRDRDSPVTKEGIIFRVMGYNHPLNACFCDVEYAPETIYVSEEKRALREGKCCRYYKFYFDGGLKFIKRNYPQYTIFSEVFGKRLVGLKEGDIAELRRPDQRLKGLLESDRDDKLVRSLRSLLDLILEVSSLKLSDFGVFGSLMHYFYHEDYSDIDLVIYGREELRELLEVLGDFYKGKESELMNEFDTVSPSSFENWRFKHYSPKEYVEYQRRKLIYAVYKTPYRLIKVEFEPVMKWEEVTNEYPMYARIRPLAFVEAKVRVINDDSSYFMPSTYEVEVIELKGYSGQVDIRRVVSYVEEFRMQLKEGETGLVRGVLEEVMLKSGEVFHQITLSYISKNYFEQVLKRV